MARRSQCIAIVPLVLSVLTGGCQIATRPCAPGNWNYHSSDELGMTCCQQRKARQCIPDEREFARQPSPDAVPARRFAESMPEAQASNTRVVSASGFDGRLCDWQESDQRPPPKPKPHRKPAVTPAQRVESLQPATSAAAKSADKPTTAAAPLPDRTPFNWGFFGAVTR
jgi:hypothetical protein